MASPQGPVWVSSMHGGLETDGLLIMAAQGSKQVSKKNRIDNVSLFMILPQKSHCVILPWSQAHLDSGRGNTDPWPHGCATCSHTGPHPQKSSTLGLMCSCCWKRKCKILNTFQARGPAFALHAEPGKLCSWSCLEGRSVKVML